MTSNMPTTTGRAQVIGNRLYSHWKNRRHCEAWCKDNLDDTTAAGMVERVYKAKYYSGDPSEENYKIITREREHLIALGYVPEEVSKSE